LRINVIHSKLEVAPKSAIRDGFKERLGDGGVNCDSKGLARYPFGHSFFLIPIYEAVFVKNKIMRMNKTLFMTGFLSGSCNFNAVSI
jgi:hypothetical protein